MSVIDEQRARIEQLEAEVIAAARCCTDIARTLRAADHDSMAEEVTAIARHATELVPDIAASMATKREAEAAKDLRDRLRRAEADCAAGQAELEKLRGEKLRHESALGRGGSIGGYQQALGGSLGSQGVLSMMGQSRLQPVGTNFREEAHALNIECDALRDTVRSLQDERAELRRQVESLRRSRPRTLVGRLARAVLG